METRFYNRHDNRTANYISLLSGAKKRQKHISAVFFILDIRKLCSSLLPQKICKDDNIASTLKKTSLLRPPCIELASKSEGNFYLINTDALYF
jgi:hypothetical protein